MKKYFFVLFFISLTSFAQGELPVSKGRLKIDYKDSAENKPLDLSLEVSNKIDFKSQLLSKEEEYLKKFSVLNKEKIEKSFLIIEQPTVDFNKDWEKKLNQSTSKKRESNGESNKNISYGYLPIDSHFARIICLDFGEEDGDLISISNNGEMKETSLFMPNAGKEVFLELKEGENVLIFTALNEGYASPNTAAFKIFDEVGNLIYSNQWNLDTGNKASIVLINKRKETPAPENNSEVKKEE